MPNNDYRMWEEDIVKEQRRSAGGSVVADPSTKDDIEDEDYFDDFVIIDKVELKKYNEPKKLKKEEEKMKDAGGSQLLIAKPGSILEEQPYKLEDFKIKKVIDKGSFGKVFLVVNKQNKQMYAMKRINKDILIDKNQI